MFAPPERGASGSISRPGSESPGERASTPGRARAASFQRSGHYNAVSVRKNGQRPPVSPPTLPPKSRLPAPPPPNDPPPNNPPPRAPHERDEEVNKRLNAATRNRTKPVRAESLGRPSTPPKRPPRPTSELFLMPSQESPLRHPRPTTERAVTTSCATPRGESPLRQMTTIHQVQDSIKTDPLVQKPSPATSVVHDSSNTGRLVQKPTSPAASVVQDAYDGKASPLAIPPRSSRASVMSLRRPPLTEESINAAAAQMIKDRRGSSSTMSSIATSSASLPYPLFSTRHNSSAFDRAVGLTSLRRVRSALVEGSRSTSGRRNARKRTAYSLDSHPNGTRSIFTRRTKAATTYRAALLDIDDLDGRVKRQSRVAKSKPMTPTTPQTPGRRKRKGETMSMLIDDGFFPVEELVYGKKSPMKKAANRYTSMAGFKINIPPRLSFIETNWPLSPITPSTPDTPNTPGRIDGTSTTPRSARDHRYPGHSILPQISESEDSCGDEGAAAKGDSDQPLSSSVADAPQAATTEAKWPPPPTIVAPVATQIHLRNGSIVTLTPPELTAWQPTIYIHGPIMLPKPTIMPRKNSVATLDPFQDAVEKLYQDALVIPRRRSDDAVVDDICDFFDAFGFDLISFAGDDFSQVDLAIGEVTDVDLDLETFSTPPLEPAAVTPVEAMIASEMLEQNSSSPSPPLQAPPVENEATLRARGIARVSRNAAGATPIDGRPGRKESNTLGKPQTSAVVPLKSAPETSTLEAVLQPGQGQGTGNYSASVYGQRFPDSASASVSRKSHEGVEEMVSAESAGTGRIKAAGGAASKEPKLSRMRRLVATASSIL